MAGNKVHADAETFQDFTEGSDDTALDPASGVWNMKENDVVGQLNDRSFKKRVEILEQLIATVKRNGGHLPYSDNEAIFRGLGLALSDTHWEIRLKCIGLLQELIPSLQADLDHCMSLVLNKLISNIGDNKVTLRRAVISTLHRYMKHTHNLPALLQAIVNTGLENESAGVRREMIGALPMLLTKDFTDANLNGIIQSLAKKLLDTSAENNMKDVSLSALQSIEKLLGEEQFNVYIQRLSPSLQRYFHQLTEKTKETEEQRDMQETVDKQVLCTNSLKFGCIPAHVITCVSDKKDFKIRTQAIEDLKGVIMSLTPYVISQRLTPHIIPLVSFLSSLLDDTNFKIITVTLDILYLLVEQLGRNVKNYIKNFVTALTKRLDDNKIVIRQSIMQILIKMMQCSSPQLVISVLFDNLTHQNSRVRQETVNFIIAALLTFPSYEFVLPGICQAVGPCLTDVKRQVRHAALECFAVLAQAMGPGRLQPLVQAVDHVEITSDGEGLMAAVQARLARRQLPRLNAVGLVEYATPLPSSASHRSNSAGRAADTKWILAVASGSVHSVRSDLELESVASFSARTGPAKTNAIPSPQAPGRVMIAGCGRNQLPWQDEQGRAYENLPNSAHAEFITGEKKPLPTLVGDAESRTPPIARRGPAKRRTTGSSLGPQQQQQDQSAGPYSKNYHHRQHVANGLRTQSFNGTGDLPGYRDNKDNGYTRPEQRTSRPVLDPISGSGDASTPRQGPLARGSTTHRGGAKVPPIASSAGAAVSMNEDEADSAYSASTSTTPSRTGSQGRLDSGGGRKKSQQQFDSLGKETHGQTPLAADSQPRRQRNEAFTITSSSVAVSSQEKGRAVEETTAGTRRSKPMSNQTWTLSHRHAAGDNLDINDNNSKHSEAQPVRTNTGAAENQAVDYTGSGDYSEKNSIAEKQRMKKEQEEQARLELEQDSELRQERERQQQKLKKLGSNDSLSEGGLSITWSNSPSPSKAFAAGAKTTAGPKPPAPSVTSRKTVRNRSSEAVTSQPRTPMERSPETEPPAQEWKPFSDPEAALRVAQKKMENDDWEAKTEGLDIIRRLVHFHPHTISPAPVLHSVILLVVREVKNLRSQVSRLAIMCLGDMFVGLKKAMDPDIEMVTSHLLGKAGESNNFIRDDVDRSLSAMVEGVTAKQALLSLILGGATHKNTVVRRTTAQFVVGVVERMGPSKILSGAKDVTDRVLPTAAQFVQDGSPETRFYGRKILFLLMSHQDFDRMLTKHLPANTLRNIQDVVENLKNKGMGDKPNETASARSRRSGLGSRMGSSVRGSSAASVEGHSSTPPTHRKAMRMDEATLNEIQTLMSQLTSSDWRVRYEAVTAFQQMCVERPHTVTMHIVKILDKFCGRLQDANIKVLVHSLEVMLAVVPLLKEALHAVISMAVTALVPNLASRNSQVTDTADRILDSFLQHLDHAVLIQPFSNQAQCATGHSKAQVVHKVAYLTDRVYDRKPKQIVLHVLPLLWHLLAATGGGAGGDLRSATETLAKALHGHMGQALLDRAAAEPSVTARHIDFLHEVL